MSLKGFHIVFIICSIVITLFFGVWSINNSSGGYLITGIVSFILSACLAVYGISVFKKLQV